ncbi:MAG TPA: N-acetylmuramoyl-L-alanine amidase [Terriglobales bacterium]
MRRIDGVWEGKRRRFASPAQRIVLPVALLVLLVLPLQPQSSSSLQRLSVYAPRGSFTVPLQQNAGREYVGILDLLDPLGQLSARQDGRKWKMRFNGTEVEFQDGKSAVKVGNERLDLPSPFYFQDGRGMVPLAGIVPLLSPLLRQPLELHESSRRLFLGEVAVRFTAQSVHTPADSVVLSFSAAVNPSIATEPGQLRMTFAREPLMHASPSTMSFENKSIPSLSYREADGVAELTLSSSVPLLARFSPDRKTITVGPVVEIVAQAKPQPATPTATPAPAPPPSSAVPTQPPSVPPGQQPAPATAAPVPSAPPPVVVVDASHGGTETGAALSDTLTEKDVTLGIALRLHNDLESRGLRTLLLRNSDTFLSLDQRAVLANASRARFYISLHAGSLGTGVRLYTALLPPITPASGPFLPWDTAQATFLSSSQTLSGNIAAEFAKANVATRQMYAPLPPLNHIAGVAVAVEVVPPGADVSQLNSPTYQEQVAAAIAAGVARAQQGATP